jgi:LmbE family N-acetylglucosaminyl deacetylase
MKFSQHGASVLVPDGLAMPEALRRVTHLGVGAHQDDLEFMAFHGIAACFQAADQWFGGVTCTNGAGSARAGAYAQYTDAAMQEVRREEQNLAARVGRYGFMAQLDHPSANAKSPMNVSLREDLVGIFQGCRPRIVYTHQPADKHATHLGVLVAVIAAIRELPAEARPLAVHGCEVWRNLDWMDDSEKTVHNLSGHDVLAGALNGIFDSQIAGGKRYDLAVMGRRQANAVFFDSHATDGADSLAYAMDLTPLIRSDTLDLVDFTMAFVERFSKSVREGLERFRGCKV